MDQIDVHFACDEHFQGGFVSGFVHQVSKEYDDTFAGVFQAEASHGFFEGGLWQFALRGLQGVDQAMGICASAQYEGLSRAAKGADRDAISSAQSDVAQCGCDSFGCEELGWCPVFHRKRVIDEGIEVKVFFFEKDLQVEAIEPSKEVPIDESKVIARDVVSEVSEFDTLSFSFAASLPFHAAAKDLARDQLHPFQLGHHLRRQDDLVVIRRCHRLVWEWR